MKKILFILLSVVLLAGTAAAKMTRPAKSIPYIKGSTEIEKNLNVGDNATVGKNLTVAGGDFSKLTLDNNASDTDTTDEYGLRIVNGVSCMRLGTVSIPTMTKGINSDMAALLETTTNSITNVFGEELDYPVVISDPAPEVFPHQPYIATEDGRYAGGVAFKHTGAAVDWDATGYYTADLFTELGSPTAQLNSAGYLYDNNTDTDAAQVLIFDIPTGVTSIEIAGKIDCSGSSYTSGSLLAHVGLYAAGWPLIRVGFLKTASTGSTAYYSASVSTSSPTESISATSGEITYRILVERLSATNISYTVDIDGRQTINGSDYAWGADLSTANLDFRSSAQGANSFDGKSDIKNYGFFITYDD